MSESVMNRAETSVSGASYTDAAASSRPSYQAYQILHIGFTAAPVIAGLDKFLQLLTNWDLYLAPALAKLSPLANHGSMLAVGVIEILAGVLVAFKPRIGAYIVTFWLWGIIINLLLIPNYFDIALRDFGLSLGALALGRLSREYGSPSASIGGFFHARH